MINKDRLQKNRLDLIQVHDQIQKITSQDLDAFLQDPRNALALRYLLIEAVEAIVDTCQHLLAHLKGIPCEGYVDCILKAGQEGLIPVSLSNSLRKLASLQNSLIHRYWVIQDDVLYQQTRDHAQELLAFAERIRQYVGSVRFEKSLGEE